MNPPKAPRYTELLPPKSLFRKTTRTRANADTGHAPVANEAFALIFIHLPRGLRLAAALFLVRAAPRRHVLFIEAIIFYIKNFNSFIKTNSFEQNKLTERLQLKFP